MLFITFESMEQDKSKYHIFRCVIIIFFTLFIISCNDYRGMPGASNSMQKSKQRNVFVSEYTVKSNPYVINDSLKLNIREAWVEKRWSYGHTESETYLDEGYQLIIRTNKSNLKNYAINWTIGLYGDHSVRSCADDCLMSDFKNLPDSIERWKVQKGYYLDSQSKKEIIGEFEIYKK